MRKVVQGKFGDQQQQRYEADKLQFDEKVHLFITFFFTLIKINVYFVFELFYNHPSQLSLSLDYLFTL